MGEGRQLAPGEYYLDDLAAGDWFGTGGIQVTESQIAGFAGIGGDFFDLHMDDAFARDLGFPGRVAHGLLVLTLVDGLKNRAPVRLAAIASLGWDWKFVAPVFIGDRIEATVRVAGTRVTSRGDRGVAHLAFTVANQDGVTVQEGTNALMMRRRQAAD
jgi:acyl dehydratase